MPSPLVDLVHSMIDKRGPLPFDEFMDLALYSDPHGYYRSHVPGRDADYRTSPSLTSLFGRLVLARLQLMWEELGRPESFEVVEVGAGGADLAATVLKAATGEFAGALRWTLVEPLATVAAFQQAQLAGEQSRTRWVPGLAELSPVVGVVLAHEVLDNFPVRVFQVEEQGIEEVRVGWDGRRLVEVLTEPVAWDPPADMVLEVLEPGDRFERICGLEQWTCSASRALEKGFLVVVDYGDLEPDVWEKRPAGSLVTYRDGRLGIDPLLNPGETDITAHVNFSELDRAAGRAGFSPGECTRQRDWLVKAGHSRLVNELKRAEAIARWEGRHADWVGLIAERSRFESLTARGGLGDHLVFTARRLP
ncbi:MAG: SAM-dependent methyltransferase [Actinomycetota bacterium]